MCYSILFPYVRKLYLSWVCGKGMSQNVPKNSRIVWYFLATFFCTIHIYSNPTKQVYNKNTKKLSLTSQTCMFYVKLDTAHSRKNASFREYRVTFKPTDRILKQPPPPPLVLLCLQPLKKPGDLHLY